MPANSMIVPSTFLQSKDHSDLLNIIDDLRSQGISHYVDLPQVIVCGDQSSGKSSVLEAVSGIRFPQKDNLCTRFATEVILRRGPEQNFKVSIVPGTDRTEQERARLLEFHRTDVDLNEFETLVQEARDAMGIDLGSRAFSTDILRVEISGPSQPHLTLVDLPGLFQAGNKVQSDDDARAVTSLVLSYMRKTRSIILAVVSAKNDFANQIVTKYAREIDPDGLRTIGIITKPDTLHEGSESEQSFVELAENRDVRFRLGWHVVRNRDYDTRHHSMNERDEMERDFFSKGLWVRLPRRHTGIASLKSRLSTLLRDQILSELPSLVMDVEIGIDGCKETISRLGASRSTLQEQRTHLLRISQDFASLAKSAIDGVYNDSYFGSASTEIGYKKRLRAVIQNTLLDFAATMRQKGHTKHIVDQVTKKKRTEEPRFTTREEFIDEVLLLMKRTRGRELPGMYNPNIVADLFYEQSKAWHIYVRQCSTQVWEATMLVLSLILDHTADENTAVGLRRHIVNPAMDDLRRKLEDMASTVLAPHRRGHPITYNHYLVENIQKMKEDHQKKFLSKKLDEFFGTNSSIGITFCQSKSFDVKNLLNSITQTTVSDMDRYACSEVIDFMKAYYKVAMKTLIDDFSVLAVEKCLLQELPDLLSPRTVISLEDVLTAQIAAETEESVAERTETTHKFQVLENALTVLRSLAQSQTFDAADSDACSTADRGADPSEELADENEIDETDTVSRAKMALRRSAPQNDNAEPPLEVEEVPLDPSEPTEAIEGAFSGAASKKKAQKIKKLSAAFGEFS